MFFFLVGSLKERVMASMEMQKFATEMEALAIECNQVLPDEALAKYEYFVDGLDIFLLAPLEKLKELTAIAKESVRHTMFVSVENDERGEEEARHSNNNNSASSGGSAATELYESVWDEAPMYDALTGYGEVLATLNGVLVQRSDLQRMYNADLSIGNRSVIKIIRLNNQAGMYWSALQRTEAFARWQAAESGKNDRIARAKWMLDHLKYVTTAVAQELLSVKHDLVDSVGKIPVPTSHLSKETRELIHNLLLSTIPLVRTQQQHKAPTWVEQVGYQMGRVFRFN